MNARLLLLFFFHIIHPEASTIIYHKTIPQFMSEHKHVSAILCGKNHRVAIPPCPIYSDELRKNFLPDIPFAGTYLLNVPDGHAYYDSSGYFFINNTFIDEFVIKKMYPVLPASSITVDMPEQGYYIAGTVAIISHLYPYCYGHWIIDVLCQLALLELCQIKYDFLVTPYDDQFMADSLEMWGVDRHKIIPLFQNMRMKANNLIISTPVTATIDHNIYPGNYTLDFLIHYVRQKLLEKLSKADHKALPTKIFISRSDAQNKRFVPNEDEIFKLFEVRGFKKVILSIMPFAQQVELFHNADEVVSFVGSGATNIIFCKPGTKYIEITQSMHDVTFFYLASICQLNYHSINVCSKQDLEAEPNPWAPGQIMPLEPFIDFLHNHPEL